MKSLSKLDLTKQESILKHRTSYIADNVIEYYHANNSMEVLNLVATSTAVIVKDSQGLTMVTKKVVRDRLTSPFKRNLVSIKAAYHKSNGVLLIDCTAYKNTIFK